MSIELWKFLALLFVFLVGILVGLVISYLIIKGK
jgi:hypothetical protein